MELMRRKSYAETIRTIRSKCPQRTTPEKKASEKQVAYIKSLLEKKSYSEIRAQILLNACTRSRMDRIEVDFSTPEKTTQTLENITMDQASRLIDELQQMPTKEEEARREENYRIHDELVERAKELGLDVKKSMTSATLRKMIAEVA